MLGTYLNFHHSVNLISSDLLYLLLSSQLECDCYVLLEVSNNLPVSLTGVIEVSLAVSSQLRLLIVGTYVVPMIAFFFSSFCLLRSYLIKQAKTIEERAATERILIDM